MEIKQHFLETVKFVNAVAEDVRKNGCSKEVITHAKGYAHLENEYGEFWRINWGGVYAYVDINEDGSPTGNIWWNNEDIGCDKLGYEETIIKLETMSEEVLNTTEASYFEENESINDNLLSKYEPLQ